MSDIVATVARNDVWAASVGIPEYECHKRVRAAKVVEVLDERAVTMDNGFTWVFGPQQFERLGPEVGGYVVFYADGYVSYSPAKAFEEGYTKL